jgi:5S rRNA maturation endonuclease (ribonuclease M5)
MNNKALQQKLDDVFEELIAANETIPIIVEGKNDEAALRLLGVSGVVIRLNTGLSILNFCEDVAKQYNEVILLPDWDDKGKQLLERLQHHFKYTPARVNDRFWHDLKRICSREIVEVEHLTKFIDN